MNDRPIAAIETPSIHSHSLAILLTIGHLNLVRHRSRFFVTFRAARAHSHQKDPRS